MRDTLLYNIGGHTVRIHYDAVKLRSMLPSFSPFEMIGDEADVEVLFDMYIQDAEKAVPAAESLTLVREVDTGNGTIQVDIVNDGGYFFTFYDIQGTECCSMRTSADYSQLNCHLDAGYHCKAFSLNNMLMVAYAIRAAFFDTLLMHASVVRRGNKAYAFTAKSGTGKSTHVANWMTVLPECDIVNDDNPVVRVIDGKAMLYGSPWSGKTTCYRNIAVPLGAVMQIKRAEENWAERQQPVMAFSTILSSCSAMKWDTASYRGICHCIQQLIPLITVGTIHCTTNPQSAEVCSEFLGA